MARRAIRSVSTPIILSSVTVALSIGMLVAWIYVILKNLSLTQQYVQNTSLLIAGIVSLAVIMTVLILFTVFLAREIREVRRQTSFIDSVTHELRSPLASIRLALETLSRPGVTEVQRGELRGMMLDDVDRLTSLIEDILQATRIQHGEITSENQDFHLREVAEVAVAAAIKRHHVPAESVRLDVDAELILSTDPAALEIILKNLVDNALKYSDDSPDVTVRAEADDDSVCIMVQDAGVGIPKRDLKRIFERFYRVPEVAVRTKRGTGLGLFLVSALVKNLGGKILAESRGAGEGALFTVTLPRTPSTPDPKASEVHP